MLSKRARAKGKIKEKKEKDQLNRLQDPRKVYVVHGRNLKARDALFTFLRSIDLRPIEWSQAIKATGEGSPYIGEILDKAFSIAQAIVVLMTPDDEAQLRRIFRKKDDKDYESKLTPQPRQNVLFEAGMAMGRHHDRTILIELGDLRPFSDILGRHTIRLNNTPEKRQELIQRLKNARCKIDISGTDWLKTGDFDQAHMLEEGSIDSVRDLEEINLKILETARSDRSITTQYAARKLGLEIEEVMNRAMILEDEKLLRIEMLPSLGSNIGGLYITARGLKLLDKQKQLSSKPKKKQNYDTTSGKNKFKHIHKVVFQNKLTPNLIVRLAKKWEGRLFDLENFAKIHSISWKSVRDLKPKSSFSVEAFAQGLVAYLQYDQTAFIDYLNEVGAGKDPELIQILNDELGDQGIKVIRTTDDGIVVIYPDNKN